MAGSEDRRGPSPFRFGRTATEKRFIAAFGVVVALFSAAAYVALAGLDELHTMMHDSVATSRALIHTQRIESTIHGLYRYETEAALSGSKVGAAHAEAENDFGRLLAGAGDAGVSPHFIELLASARANLNVALARQPRAGDGVGAARAKLLKRLEEVQREVRAYSAAVDERLARFDDHASAVAHDGVRNALALGLCVAALTIVIGMVLARSVARPLALLHAGAERIADGDLSTRVAVTGPGEFRALARQFNEMIRATEENQVRLVESQRLAGIGRLAAGVAHEINNPLGVIRGYARLVSKRATDSQIEADAKVIEDECIRCSETVQGLLDLARPPVGQPVPVQLRETVDEIVERTVEAEPSLLGRVQVSGAGRAWGNSRTIRQVLVNLIENALQADPEGTVEVRVASEAGDVMVEVGDRGQGLPSEDLDRVFEPFFTTKATGTGLGLAVSRSIARAHGGDVCARERQGGGALFTLTLPVPPEEKGQAT